MRTERWGVDSAAAFRGLQVAATAHRTWRSTKTRSRRVRTLLSSRTHRRSEALAADVGTTIGVGPCPLPYGIVSRFVANSHPVRIAASRSLSDFDLAPE